MASEPRAVRLVTACVLDIVDAPPSLFAFLLIVLTNE